MQAKQATHSTRSHFDLHESSHTRRSPGLPLLLLAIAALALSSVAGSEEETRDFSIAISGGASKGAYEGGLTWASLKIVQIGASGITSSQPRLPNVRSIAGTSAGGINTLLAGMAWCVNEESEGGFPNGLDSNIFRDTWLVPDINNLLPPAPTSPPYLPDDAAMSRQAFVAIVQELQTKWERPSTFRAGCSVPLGVTVTRTTPAKLLVGEIEVMNQRFYVPFELHTQEDGSGVFSFNPEDYPLIRDPTLLTLPWTTSAREYSVSGEQIVNSVFATSAYPTGLGRRRITYCQLEQFTNEKPAETIPGIEDLRCPAGYELAESEFADGGLFDNLPLGLARLLAEERAGGGAQPVTYLYLDPNRLRFTVPESEIQSACDSEDPPDACRTMEFSIASEFAVIGGFLGTARKYALYDELTGDRWQTSLFGISIELAAQVEGNPDIECQSLQRYFGNAVSCSEALLRSGEFLNLTYTAVRVPIVEPFSDEKLQRTGVASSCHEIESAAIAGTSTECIIDRPEFREQLIVALRSVASQLGPGGEQFDDRIARSARSVTNDRNVVVTSLGAPITGQLLGAFGAFLEYKFREYDYYVGVFDAVVLASINRCEVRYSPRTQESRYRSCIDYVSELLHESIGVSEHARARHVFALLAKRSFGSTGGLQFAYDPMPPEDRDMQVIHEALEQTLLTRSTVVEEQAESLTVERVFFDYLRDADFQPTPPPDGGEPFLSLIIQDPEHWLYELTNRWTTRMVYLEQQAEDLFTEREPDPEIRKSAHTGLMGLGAWGLQTATYKYPDFAFAPSTAPVDWIWRNIIPYEIALDFVEGDILVLWQPTWHVGTNTNLGIRFGVGTAGGLFRTSQDPTRENYGVAGLDVTFLSGRSILPNWGFTPAIYHNFKKPESADQTTFGLDVHTGFAKNRIRLGLGARDVSDFGNTWFFTIGVADLPGMIYWLSR